MNLRNHKGIAPAVVIGAIALLGAIGVWVAKPKKLHGESQRAEASTEATAKLEEAHQKEIAALNRRSSEAAASVAVMNDVTANLPTTPEKKFLQAEGKVVASKLEAPDPAELLKVEERKNAILTGKVAMAEALYSEALKHSADLADNLATAKAETAKAQAQREAVDAKLTETAALHRGMERQRNATILAIAALAVIYLWTKVTHLSPSAVAELASDLRKGKDGLTALDGVASRLQQKLSSIHHNLFHSSK